MVSYMNIKTLLLLGILTSCTYSIQNTVNVDIGGQLEDTVEDEQSQDIKPDTNLNIPVKP